MGEHVEKLGELELDRVYCGKCLLHLESMPAGSVDAVIGECPIMLVEYFEDAYRVLNDSGVFIFRAEPTEKWIGIWTERFESVGINVEYQIVTKNMGDKDGNDLMLVGGKKPLGLEGIPDRIDPGPSRPQFDIIPSAERDVKTYKELIELFTPKNGIVIDLCAGSSASGEAAILAGRRWIGFDIVDRLVAIGNERLEKASNGESWYGDDNKQDALIN